MSGKEGLGGRKARRTANKVMSAGWWTQALAVSVLVQTSH